MVVGSPFLKLKAKYYPSFFQVHWMCHDLVEVRVDRLAKKHEVLPVLGRNLPRYKLYFTNATNCVFFSSMTVIFQNSVAFLAALNCDRIMFS